MPTELKADLIEDKTLSVINKFMIFNRLAPQDLKTILCPETGDGIRTKVAAIFKYAKGETVINEGDFGTCSFWVVKGIFDVIQNGIHLATLSRPGEVFGEMSVFEKIPRVATVRSMTQGVCLCLDMGVLDRLQDRRIKAMIQKEFSVIMRARLEETRQWLEDERRRIDEKYADLLASKKRLQDRLAQKP